MENPGCVTFDDSYISSTELDKEDYANFIILIVHEICHHWFGNYVTMKWWDDVWLNEAFAEYISHYCARSIKISTPIEDIRLCLNQCKQRGYDEDQLESTHPIASEVLNADLAKTIFDGITYNKGASVIQVLINLIGEKQFGDACHTYFVKYAWGNTKLVQFIECMQQEWTIDLTQWTYLWIKQAGCNSVQCEWNESRILLAQKAVLSKYPLLREHRINIAIFYDDGTFEEKQSILYDQLTINLSKNNIVAVFPNYGDLAFIKIVLDSISEKWLLQNFQKLDTLTRQMLFRCIYEKFNDAALTAAEFITLIHLLDNEVNTLLIQDFLDKIHQSLQYSDQRAELSGFVFNKILDLIAEEELIDLIPYYSSKLYKFAIQKIHIQKLLNWIKGQDLLYIQYTASDIYNILDLGMAAQFIVSNAQLQQWLSYPSIKLDQYDLAKLSLRSKAYFINITQREQLWDDYCSPVPQLSLKNSVESMQAFNTHFRINDLIKYGDKFFQQIQYIYQTRSHVLAETFYINLFPYYLPLSILIQVIFIVYHSNYNNY